MKNNIASFTYYLFLALCIVIGSCSSNGYAQCGDADGFVMPVGQGNPQETWGVPGNPFGHYYGTLGGHHPGADINLTNGANGEADFGKPVYAAGDGRVEGVSPLGTARLFSCC